MLDQQFNMRKEHDTKGSRKKTNSFQYFCNRFSVISFCNANSKIKIKKLNVTMYCRTKTVKIYYLI